MTDNAFKGTTSRSLTGEQVDEVAAKYRKGATVAELAVEYKCSTAPIRNALKMRGVRPRTGAPRAGRAFGQSLNGRIS
jgi:hypothetical protein